MTMRNLLTLCLACGIAAACGGDAAGNESGSRNETAGNKAREASNSVADALRASVDHTAFLQALQSAGLIETLGGVGPYTVFAPTNAAFDAIPEDARARLAAADQRERLISLLSYHIVPGTVTTEDLARAIERNPGGRAELATVTGDNLSLSREGDAIVIGDGAGGRARVIRADGIHSNGVVHSIEAVLMPGGE